jgi:hypothetical protein
MGKKIGKPVQDPNYKMGLMIKYIRCYLLKSKTNPGKKMSQEEFADLFGDDGISVKTVKNWEAGHMVPDAVLIELAEMVNMDYSRLIDIKYNIRRSRLMPDPVYEDEYGIINLESLAYNL